MKKHIILLAVILTVFNSYSQDTKFSASLSYPTPVGDNFVKRYSGILDLGVQYRVAKLGPVHLGLSTNFTLLTFEDERFQPVNRINAYFVQPRIFGEIDLESLKRFKPALGIGYTYLSFNYKNGQNIEEPKVDYNGFNINISGTYDITNWLFALVQYEFIKIKNDIGDQISYNTNLAQFKIGVGARF